MGSMRQYPSGQLPKTTYPASISVVKALFSPIQHNIARITCINQASISVQEAFLLSTQHSMSENFLHVFSVCFIEGSTIFNFFLRRILCIHKTSISVSINLFML